MHGFVTFEQPERVLPGPSAVPVKRYPGAKHPDNVGLLQPPPPHPTVGWTQRPGPSRLMRALTPGPALDLDDAAEAGVQENPVAFSADRVYQGERWGGGSDPLTTGRTVHGGSLVLIPVAQSLATAKLWTPPRSPQLVIIHMYGEVP